jgi:predicted transcriptional regulator
MVVIGSTKQMMADYLGITQDTLRKHFSTELKTAKTGKNIAIVNTLYQRAIRGDTTALIFWCKTQLGWKETQVQEYVLPQISLVAIDGSVVRTTKDGQPDVITDADYEETNDDERRDS